MKNHEELMMSDIEQVLAITQQNTTVVWIDEDQEDDRDTLLKPRNRHILSEDEWKSILG